MKHRLPYQKIKAVTVVLAVLITTLTSHAQVNANANFGNNPAAGHYLAMNDSTKIYYETYGSGKPVVLLHGGLFGDISEYERLIPKLSENYLVIAVETRGHGKSYIGHIPFTYSLMAEDAYNVVRHITQDSVSIISFSDGAITAMALTIAHPEMVKKLVFAGGNLSSGDYKPGELEGLKKLSGESMEKEYPEFVKGRKSIMPEPGRWDDFVELLKQAWLQSIYFDQSKVPLVECPVLVTGGDTDQYMSVETYVGIYRKLPHAQLAIIPGSDHLVFYRRYDLMEALILTFLQR